MFYGLSFLVLTWVGVLVMSHKTYTENQLSDQGCAGFKLRRNLPNSGINLIFASSKILKYKMMEPIS